MLHSQLNKRSAFPAARTYSLSAYSLSVPPRVSGAFSAGRPGGSPPVDVRKRLLLESLIVSRLYISHMSLDSELLEAARKGDVRKVRELLDRGADVDARDKYGWTPLHLAAYRGYAEVARLLLDRGANVDARDDVGDTPLHWAAHDGHLDVVELLLEHGADASAKDGKGKTPLDLAREKGYVEVARVIEEYSRVRSAPSILGVEYSSFYAGEWGRLLVKVKGAGLASLSIEGNVEWMDPGRIRLSGGSVVEVPVKPGVAGELPVRITVRSGSGEDVRIAWLKVSEKAKKCPVCGVPVEPGAKYCWKCGAKLA
jgi:hypothetical protein